MKECIYILCVFSYLTNLKAQNMHFALPFLFLKKVKTTAENLSTAMMGKQFDTVVCDIYIYMFKINDVFSTFLFCTCITNPVFYHMNSSYSYSHFVYLSLQGGYFWFVQFRGSCESTERNAEMLQNRWQGNRDYPSPFLPS